MSGEVLGIGVPTVYLYDRGGKNRLYEFPRSAMAAFEWERTLNELGTATLDVIASLCDCTWLNRIRAVRHELVVYRDAERVWEGPVWRVAYSPRSVKIIAKDLGWWFSNRAIAGLPARRFRTGNVVDVVTDIIKTGFAYDDPNLLPYVLANNLKGSTVTVAYNPYEKYVRGALDDGVDAGLDWTFLGRRLVLWAAVNPIARTALLRTPET